MLFKILFLSSNRVFEYKNAFYTGILINIYKMSWFNSRQELTPTQPLAQHSLVGRGRKSKGMSKKTCGDSSIGKAKPWTSKVKSGIQSSLPTGRWRLSHLQESAAPSFATLAWEDKCHHSKCSSFFSQLYMLIVTIKQSADCMGCPFGQSGSGRVPFQLLVPSQPAHLLTGAVGWGAGKALTVANTVWQRLKHLFITNTVLSRSPKHRATLATVILSQWKPQM